MQAKVTEKPFQVKNVYILAILSLFAGQIFAQGTAIKRASLSTSVANAHSIQNGQYKVQQSIAHMGIMGSITHDSHTMTRGFLLPQMGAPAEKPIADFNWAVYPNPFATYINIDFDAPVSGDMVVRIHDVTGQLIMEKEVVAKEQQRIHLGHLAQAEYVLTAELMGKTFSQVLLNYKNLKEDN